MLQSTAEPHLLSALDSHHGLEITAHNPTDAITVPDAHLLFSGNFKRAGTDLIISDATHKFVVHDYFRGEARPTLLSPEGASLSGAVVQALTGPGDYAQAGQPQNDATVIGRVDKATGDTTAVRNGVAVTLHVGDVVQKGDVVQTGSGSEIAISFTDGTAFNLKENARMVLNDFVYQANATNNSAFISLVQGTITFVAGEVAHTGDMKVQTPVATMGIRGTSVLVTIESNNGPTTFAIVPDPNSNHVGSFVLLDNNTGQVIATVNQVGVAVQVQPTGPLQVVAQQLNLTPQQLQQNLAIVQQAYQTYINTQQNPVNPNNNNNNQNNQNNPNDQNQNQNPNDQHTTQSTPSGGSSTSVTITQIDDNSSNNSNNNSQTPTTPSTPTTPTTPTPPDTGPTPPSTPPPQDNTAPTPVVIPDVTPPSNIPASLPAGPTITSVSPSGTPSSDPHMSADGRFVVYDPPGTIYLVDTQSSDKTPFALSDLVLTQYPDSGYTGFSNPSISADGHYILFQGEKTGSHEVFVVTNFGGGQHQLFDLGAGADARVDGGGDHIVLEQGTSVEVLTRDGSNTQPTGWSASFCIAGDQAVTNPDISANGDHITFSTRSSWLTIDGHTFNNLGDGHGTAEVYLYNAVTQQLDLVSTASGGTTPANGDSGPESDVNLSGGLAGTSAVSMDGQYVVFRSNATNLDPDHAVTPGHSNIYLRDTVAGTTTLISVGTNGEADGNSYLPAISPDGSHVIFVSDASNLVASDGNGHSDVFLYDIQHGTLDLVSDLPGSVAADGSSGFGASLSGGGLFVVFGSAAGNLGGAGDAPAIILSDSSNGTAGLVLEQEQSPNQITTTGNIRFTDVDDSHSVSVTPANGHWGQLTADITADTTGSNTAGNIKWTYTVDKAVADQVAQGQTHSDTFTVALSDGTQATVTVAIIGTNEDPVITSSPQSATGSVAEEGAQIATGQLTASDPDTGDTQTWTIDGGARLLSPDYQFAIDRFMITKTVGGTPTTIFDDTFDSTVPPAGPSFSNGDNPSPIYFVNGGFAGGTDGSGNSVALLDSDNAVFQGVRGGNYIFGDFATLNTNTQPPNVNPLGLKSGQAFTVNGLFDLATLASSESYGIRLIDRAQTGQFAQPGTETVELGVYSGATLGTLEVRLYEVDFAANTRTLLETIALGDPGSDNQILLSLANDPLNGGNGNIHASFELAHNGNFDDGTLTTFSSTGQIFDNESWTRAQFFGLAQGQASNSPTADSILTGTYGTLDIAQSGAWTYALNNGLQATQALAQGQTATDSFTVRVADSHGDSTTQVINVAVHGSNDAPQIVAGSTTATGTINALPQDNPTNADYPIVGSALLNGLGGDAGFGEHVLAANDDGSSGLIDITPLFGLNGLDFFGHDYTALYLNNNGNITFGSALSDYTPDPIGAALGFPIIAPFWADVDTRNSGGPLTPTPGGNSTGSDLVYWDLDTDHGVFTATWDDVGYFSQNTDKLNAFQLQLIDRGNGDFDIVFRYEDINWTSGGTTARAGYSAGDDNPDHTYELPQSGNQAALLDLPNTASNTGYTGVFVYHVHNGVVVSSDLTAHGVIDFTDPDLTDAHTATAAYQGPDSALGTLSLVKDQDSTGGGTGQFDWTYTVDNNALASLGADGSKVENFLVTIDDGHGGQTTQTVSITLHGTGDQAPVAQNGAASGNEDTLITGQVTATDVDNNNLTYALVSDAVDGNNNPVSGLTFHTDGSYSFEGPQNFNGEVSFTYKANDGTLDSNTATVTLTVDPVNDPPVLDHFDLTVGQGQTVLISTGVLQVTDPDSPNSSIFFSLAAHPAGGVFQVWNGTNWVDAPTGGFTYDAIAAGHVQFVQDGSNTAPSFSIWASDGTDAGPAISPTVNFGADHAPTITAGAPDLQGSVTEDDYPLINGHLTVSDPDAGDTQTWTIDGGQLVQNGADYFATADEFLVRRNGSVIFDDTFNDGVPPPSAPDFSNGSTGAYGIPNGATLLEVDGRLVMYGPLGGLTGNGFVASAATLLSDISPDSQQGLRESVTFSAGAKFDFVVPDDDRQFYGVRLTDGVNNAGGADTLEASVRRDDQGNLAIEFRHVDVSLPSPVSTLLGEVPLTATDVASLEGHQITLRLVHDTAGSQNITAQYATTYQQDGTPNWIDIPPVGQSSGVAVGQIFNGENWTRAQIISAEPTETVSTLHGTYGYLTLDQSGNWQYVLADNQANVQALYAGEHVTDTFNVTATDSQNLSDTKQIVVDVYGQNDAPVAPNATASGNEDTVITGQVTATDVDSANLTYALVSGAVDGNGQAVSGLTFNTNNGSYSFHGPQDFNGEVTFTYKADDGTLDSNTATVTLTVNPVDDAPVAQNGSASGDEDTPITGQVTATDVDNNNLTYALVSDAVDGNNNPVSGLTFNSNGSYSFEGPQDFNGGVTFTYHANDGSLDSNTATMTLTVNPVNDAPVASAPSTHYSATEQTDLTLSDGSLQVSDVDANGGTETVRLSVGEGILTVNAGDTGVSIASNNLSEVMLFGTIDQLNALLDGQASGSIVYNDTEDNPSASTSLTLTISDNGYSGSGGNLGATATATIDVTAVDDAPSASAPATYNAVEGQSLELSGTGLSVGDVDGGSGSETVTLSVGEGTITVNDSNVTGLTGNGTNSVSFSGTIDQLNALLGGTDSGSIVYNDNVDAPSASTQLTLSINDNGHSGGPAHTGSTTSTIDITPVNDAPQTNAATGSGAENDASIAVSLSGSDVDGTVASFKITDLPANGTLYSDAALQNALHADDLVTASGNAATVYFVPAQNFNGDTSFHYAAVDNLGAEDASSATATILVGAVNQPPVATDSATLTPIAEDSGAHLITQADLLSNVSDPDGPSLTAVDLAISNGQGALTDNHDGTWTYTPAANDDTAVSFSYQVTDGIAAPVADTATLDIAPVNDPPVAVADTGDATEAGGVNNGTPGADATGNVLANDTDVDSGDTKTASLVAQGVLVNAGFESPGLGSGSSSYLYNPTGAGWTFVSSSGESGNQSGFTNGNPDAPEGGQVAFLEAFGSSTTAAISQTFTAPAGTYTIQFDAAHRASYGTHPDFAVLLDGQSIGTFLPTSATYTTFSATAALATTGSHTLTFQALDTLNEGDTTAFIDDVSITPVHYGTLTLAANGDYTYVVDNNNAAVQALNANQTLTDTFAYAVTDSANASSTSTLTVTVHGEDDAPVAQDGSASGNEDTVITGQVTATDVDSPNLTYALVSGAVDGNGHAVAGLTFNTNGTYSFEGPQDFNGEVTFTYKANDGSLDGNTATVTLTVGPVNDPPVLDYFDVSVAQGGTRVLTPSDFHVTDPDSSSFFFNIQNVQGGEFRVLTDGNWVSAPTGGFTAADIAAGHVEFVQDGTSTAPSFSVNASDFTDAGPAIAPTVNFETLVVVGGGAVQEGQELQASMTFAGDNANVTNVTYQWESSSDGTTWTLLSGAVTDINGAGVATSIYQIAEADEGKQIRATASFTDADTQQTINVTSQPTVPASDVTPLIAPTFQYKVDRLTITKNSTQIYDNGFTQAPPNSTDILKDGVPQAIAFATFGSMWTAANGEAILSSSGLAPTSVAGLDWVAARLLTNTSPSDSHGLKFGANFDVNATFDLTAPTPGTSYGIELNDATPSHAGDQIVQILVQGLNDGSSRVVVEQVNNGVVVPGLQQSVTLSASDLQNSKIALDLSHTASSHAIDASFTLLDANGIPVGQATTFSNFGNIYTGGVNWMRADVVAFAHEGVLVQGDAVTGHTLTAVASTNDGDATLHYQWQTSADGGTTWNNIGTDSATYIVQATDVDHIIDVVVSRSDPDTDPVSETSAATAAVTADAPPTISLDNFTQQTAIGGVLVSIVASGAVIPLDDPDAGNDPLTLTLHVDHGTLTPFDPAANPNLTVVGGNDGSHGTLEVQGTLADLNQAVADGVIFHPNTVITGETISLIVDDGFGGTDNAQTFFQLPDGIFISDAVNGNVHAAVNGQPFTLAATEIIGNSGSFGYSVAGGDVNGDGLSDVVVGAPDHTGYGPSDNGAAYIIFGFQQAGDASGIANIVDGVLNPGQFHATALFGYNDPGTSVALGDINGDGVNEVLVGAPRYGYVYAVAGGFTLPASGVDAISAVSPDSPFHGSGYAGQLVASAGNINGDGFGDFIVGDPGTNNSSGTVFVVFGQQSFAGSTDLTLLNQQGGPSGIAIYDLPQWSANHYHVSAAAIDINGDGFSDIAVGIPNHYTSGGAAVIYGGQSIQSVPSHIQYTDAKYHGVNIVAENSADQAGFSIANAGDVNGDGWDDFIVGAPGANSDAGAAYVIFGHQTLPEVNGAFGNPVKTIDLSQVGQAGGIEGFKLTGEAAGDHAGYSVAAAGDVNGDGYGDVIIGAPDAYGGSGAVYIVLGGADLPGTISLAGVAAGTVNGVAGLPGLKFTGEGGQFGSAVAGAGDINGDGFGDVVIGAPYTSTYDSNTQSTGAAYVVFGGDFTGNDFHWVAPADANSASLAVSFDVPTSAGVTFDWGDGSSDTLFGPTNAAQDAHLYTPGFDGTLTISGFGANDILYDVHVADNLVTYPVLHVPGSDPYIMADAGGSSTFVFATQDATSGDYRDIRIESLADVESDLPPTVLQHGDANDLYFAPHLSADEQYVVYNYNHFNGSGFDSNFLLQSTAGGTPFLTGTGTGFTADIGVDLGASVTLLAAGDASIDGDGHSVVFHALYTTDVNPTAADDIFRYDWTSDIGTGTYSLVSSGTGGTNLDPVISADGGTVAWAHSDNGTLFTLDYFQGSEVDTGLALNSSASAIAISDDGHYIAYGRSGAGANSGLYVYNTDTAGITHVANGDDVTSVSMTANGQDIAYSDGTTVNLYDQFAHTVTTISGADGGLDPSISGDGHFVTYTDSVSHTIQVVDLAPVVGTTGNDLLMGSPNSFANTFVGHGGNDILFASPAHDTFVFNPTDTGHTTIVGFDTGQDLFDVSSVLSDALDIAALIHPDTTHPTDTMIDLTPDLHVTLQNVDYHNVTAQNFIVGMAPQVVGG